MTQSPPVPTAENRPMSDEEIIDSIGAYEFGWHDNDDYSKDVPYGINEDIVRQISAHKNEPEWMLERRLKALEMFERKPMPTWGPDLSYLNFDDFKYYVRPTDRQVKSWEDLPEEIRDTYDRLGIPDAEKNRLVAGVAAQYESEVVYQQIQEDLERQGVIFLDTDSGLREYPEIFKEYFGKSVPSGDNKFAALNTAAWSGGSFIYVPPGVHVEIPLQAYFRINTEAMGQFERTLIVADEGSYVHYVEGCTAPIYDVNSLHSAVVEIFVRKDARVRYTTIQNWSTNVLNLVTQRAIVEEGATMEWVDGNMGSAVTMKYPACFLMGEHARGETLSIGFAGRINTRTRAPRWCTWPPTPPRPSWRSPSPVAAVAPPTAAWLKSTSVRVTPSPTCSVTPCSLTRSPAPIPTPMSTCAPTTLKWGTRQPCPRSPKTSSST